MKRRASSVQAIAVFFVVLVVGLLLTPTTSANFQDTRRGVVVITFEEGTQQPPQVTNRSSVSSEPEVAPQAPVPQPTSSAEAVPQEIPQSEDPSSEVVVEPTSDPMISQEAEE